MTARGGQEGRNFGPIQLVADCVGVDLPSEKAAGFLAQPPLKISVVVMEFQSWRLLSVLPPPSRNFAISWRCLNQKSSQFLIRRNVLFSPGSAAKLLCLQFALKASADDAVQRHQGPTQSCHLS